MTSKIDLHNVKKRYETFQLGELSLSIPKGYITGFIGNNGQGKTTLIRSILSFIHFEGTILVDGKKNVNSDFLQRTGVVMDEPFLGKDWTIALVNQVMEVGYDHWDSRRFFDLIKRFSLPLGAKVGELLRGMKIKLMLSMALSHKGDLLILDEPTSGLDPGTRDEFVDIIQEFMEEEENTVLFSTHITGDLEAIADYILFIEEGKLVRFGTKEELLAFYLIVKGGLDDFEKMDRGNLLGWKKTSVAFEGLIRKDVRDSLPSGMITERGSIEKIMILYGRKDG